jgi:hypothetical protein
MELIIIMLLLGLLPATIAMGKGRNFLLWWLYGSVLFIFAIFHAIAAKPAERNLIFYGRRYCPHCEQIIEVDARTCLHCQQAVPPVTPSE